MHNVLLKGNTFNLLKTHIIYTFFLLNIIVKYYFDFF